MSMRSIEYSNGGLTKRHTKGGLRWAGQVKWRYVGEKKWRTKLCVLVDEDGEPIKAYADTWSEDGDDNAERVRIRNNRNRRAALSAHEKWFKNLSRTEYDRTQSVRGFLLADIETLKQQNTEARKRGNKEEYAGSTLRGYGEYVPIIAEGFDDRPMSAVTSADVARWVEGMKARGLAPSTMRKAFSILSSACDRATLRGDLPANPCEDRVRATIGKGSTKEPNSLDVAGITRVNRLLDETPNPRLRIGARIALQCGLRAGEVCGLRWRDVGTEYLHVAESIANVGEGTEVKTPKSIAGTRDVPLPRPLAKELAEWHEAQFADWQKLWAADGDDVDDDAVPFDDCRVIGYADGNHFTPNSLGHLWYRLAKGLHDRDPKDRRRRGKGWIAGREPIIGVTGELVTLHTLRHTYATHNIACGVNVRLVARRMGHADPAVTMRRYAAAMELAKAYEGAPPEVVLASGTKWATTDVDDIPADRRELTPEECALYGCEPGTVMSLDTLRVLEAAMGGTD